LVEIMTERTYTLAELEAAKTQRDNEWTRRLPVDLLRGSPPPINDPGLWAQTIADNFEAARASAHAAAIEAAAKQVPCICLETVCTQPGCGEIHERVDAKCLYHRIRALTPAAAQAEREREDVDLVTGVCAVWSGAPLDNLRESIQPIVRHWLFDNKVTKEREIAKAIWQEHLILCTYCAPSVNRMCDRGTTLRAAAGEKP
jgi:hypothetical protein